MDYVDAEYGANFQLKDNATRIYLTLFLNETSNDTYLEEISREEFYDDYDNGTDGTEFEVTLLEDSIDSGLEMIYLIHFKTTISSMSSMFISQFKMCKPFFITYVQWHL